MTRADSEYGAAAAAVDVRVTGWGARARVSPAESWVRHCPCLRISICCLVIAKAAYIQPLLLEPAKVGLLKLGPAARAVTVTRRLDDRGRDGAPAAGYGGTGIENLRWRQCEPVRAGS